MVAFSALERMGSVRERVSDRSRISVTELARSKEWREKLPASGVMEITDRGDTAGWLVSDADMAAIVEGYAYLEDQLERAQVEAMFAARPEGEPLSGDSLTAAAAERFDARKAALRGVVDGD